MTTIERCRSERKAIIGFKDKIFNKVARITVLSELLNSKFPGNDEARTLVNKIRDSAALLYSDTNDLIGFFSEHQCSAYSVLSHIDEFAMQLFSDRGTSYDNMHIDKDLEELSIPVDQALNLLLLCKCMLIDILPIRDYHKLAIDPSLSNDYTLTLAVKFSGSPARIKQLEHKIDQLIGRIDHHLDGKTTIHRSHSSDAAVQLNLMIPVNRTQ